MSGLAQAAEDYLVLRRALGFKLQRHAHLLPSFVAFLDDADASFISTDLALRWATLPAGSATWWTQRLSIARGFARYQATIDARTQIPPSACCSVPGRPAAESCPTCFRARTSQR